MEQENPLETTTGSGNADSGTVTDIRQFRHDARNQLNLIMGYADLLARPTVGQLNERQRMYIDRIRGASVQLETMLDELVPAASGGDRA